MANDSKYTHYRIEVPQEFAEVFSHFYFAENQSQQSVNKTLLPSFQTIAVFSFKKDILLQSKKSSQISLEKCIILGPIKQAFDYSMPPDSEMLVVNFKDDAFYRFFGLSTAPENLLVLPESLLGGNCFTALWSELKTMSDTSQRIAFILDFCRPYLKERKMLAEQLVSAQQSSVSNKSVAQMNQKSERTIQSHYKKYFGYTAKEVNRYQRFLKAIEIIQKQSNENLTVDWFEVISVCGYYDQSHLNHDFKHYLNLSPLQYLRFQQDICNPIN